MRTNTRYSGIRETRRHSFRKLVVWGVLAVAVAAAVTRSSLADAGIDLSWITDAIFG